MQSIIARIILALFCLTLAPTAALADLQEYLGMTPEQIESAIRVQRKAYNEAMDKVRQWENSGQDKASQTYKAKLDELLQAAVEKKVSLDEMREALLIQQKAYGGQ